MSEKSTLYKKHNYLNRNIPYLIGNEIIEYDMKSAGFNLIKKFKLIPDNIVNYLESLNKTHRQIQIGLIIKKDKELGKILNTKFVEARQWFFENNNLINEDVLSIKKDAIITLRRCHVTEWDNIIFQEKNIYTSYYYMNKKEFYYNSTGIDVKGIDDNLLENHKEYMLDFMATFFKMNEISTRKYCIDYLTSFITAYKSRELDMGYYRELNGQSLIRLNDDTLFGNSIGAMFLGESERHRLDIGYNFERYLVPLVSVLI